MKARLVVFPIKGRKWCFVKSLDPAVADSQAAHTPSTFRDLWNHISSNPKPLNANAELLVDFASNKVSHLSYFRFFFQFTFLQLSLVVSYFQYFCGSLVGPNQQHQNAD